MANNKSIDDDNDDDGTEVDLWLWLAHDIVERNVRKVGKWWLLEGTNLTK